MNSLLGRLKNEPELLGHDILATARSQARFGCAGCALPPYDGPSFFVVRRGDSVASGVWRFCGADAPVRMRPPGR